MYPIKRTPEQGHTIRCFKNAMDHVMQGWMDAEYVTASDFRSFLQDNGPMHEADELLMGGHVECLCPDDAGTQW